MTKVIYSVKIPKTGLLGEDGDKGSMLMKYRQGRDYLDRGKRVRMLRKAGFFCIYRSTSYIS